MKKVILSLAIVFMIMACNDDPELDRTTPIDTTTNPTDTTVIIIDTTTIR